MATSPCIVMVLVRTKPEFQKELADLSAKSVERMKQLRGFIAHTLLKSDDGTLIVSRIEWQTKENQEACEKHLCWEDTRKQWAPYFDSGKASMEVYVLETIQRVEASSAAR